MSRSSLSPSAAFPFCSAEAIAGLEVAAREEWLHPEASATATAHAATPILSRPRTGSRNPFSNLFFNSFPLNQCAAINIPPWHIHTSSLGACRRNTKSYYMWPLQRADTTAGCGKLGLFRQAPSILHATKDVPRRKSTVRRPLGKRTNSLFSKPPADRSTGLIANLILLILKTRAGSTPFDVSHINRRPASRRPFRRRCYPGAESSRRAASSTSTVGRCLPRSSSHLSMGGAQCRTLSRAYSLLEFRPRANSRRLLCHRAA